MEQLQFLVFGVLLIILVTNYRALCLSYVGSEKHENCSTWGLLNDLFLENWFGKMPWVEILPYWGRQIDHRFYFTATAKMILVKKSKLLSIMRITLEMDG